MVKVVMTSAAGRKIDLFSEHALLREVFEYFHEDYAGTVNGESLQQEDLDKPLLLFEKDAEVRIISIPKNDESPEEMPAGGTVQLGCNEGKVLMALLEAKKALEEAINAIEALGTLQADNEMPF